LERSWSARDDTSWRYQHPFGARGANQRRAARRVQGPPIARTGVQIPEGPIVFHLQRVRKDPPTCGGYGDGHGIMPFGLCDRGAFVARSSGQDGSEYSPPERGKPTQRPTLRWVFQLLQAVHLLSVDGAKQISNLTEERRSILGVLSSSCRRYYLLS